MNKVYMLLPEKIGRIDPNIYGQFTEHIGGVIYGGAWVGKDSDIPNIRGWRSEIVEKLRKIGIPVLRWPGGCFAETYDWRDGIGDPEKRPVRPNWWIRWDGQYESNQVGTHEFMDLCALAGAKPYFAANLNTVDILSMRDWLDYCNTPAGKSTMAQLREENGSKEPFHVQMWGLGNENWGGGGNMSPETCADLYRRMAVVFENTQEGLQLIACGPDSADMNWTHGFMKNLAGSYKHISAFSLHHYCYSVADPLNFPAEDWYAVMHDAGVLDGLIRRHWAIIQAYGMDAQVKLAVDEWGLWNRGAPVSGPSGGKNLFEQEVTMRDACVAAVTLNILNNHCDKISMANAAQLVNCIQSLFLANGPDCVATANYYVFDMFKHHMGAQAVKLAFDAGEVDFTAPDGRKLRVSRVSGSASIKDGVVTVTLCNIHLEEPAQLCLVPVGCGAGEGEVAVLKGETVYDHNTFENPGALVPQRRKLEKGELERFTLPPASIVCIRFQYEE